MEIFFQLEFVSAFLGYKSIREVLKRNNFIIVFVTQKLKKSFTSSLCWGGSLSNIKCTDSFTDKIS